MQYLDARRLTGPNHLARTPLVLVELAYAAGEDHEAGRAAYLGELARMRATLGFPSEVRGLVERRHAGGTVIGFVEAIDVMLACTEMAEWAAMSACEVLAGRTPLALEPKRAEVVELLARDRSARLLALQAEAARRGLPLLWDDEAVSLGHGARSRTWARSELPEVAEVAWESLGRVPVALVTGTNGKTTSTRWLARVAHEAGHRVGVTSSDAIAVAGAVVEAGDWTGPQAARIVLRRGDVDLAVLETARGGILRRGLAVDTCDVALVTNVADDHVGGYGIDDVAAMAEVKTVVAEAARAGGGAVALNARDPRLAALAERYVAAGVRTILFADLEAAGADDPAHRWIGEHRARGGEVAFTREGEVVRAEGEREHVLTKVARVPLAFGGAARFNVENALGVVAAARGLALPDEAIVRGLEGFSTAENPRRTSLAEKAGTRVLLDFGHNPEGVRALLSLVKELRGAGPGRLVVCLGCPGDRSDRDLEEMVRVITEARPERVILRELPGYLRGRAPGEVPEVLRRALAARGFPPAAIANAEDEVASLRAAFATATPGDFVVLLVHIDHAKVNAWLGEA